MMKLEDTVADCEWCLKFVINTLLDGLTTDTKKQAEENLDLVSMYRKTLEESKSKDFSPPCVAARRYCGPALFWNDSEMAALDKGRTPLVCSWDCGEPLFKGEGNEEENEYLSPFIVRVIADGRHLNAVQKGLFSEAKRLKKRGK